jgi:predicted small lipoprotein YifL
MKKIFALILALTMVFALAACGGETAPETTAPAAGDVAPVTPDASSWKYSVQGVDIQMHADAAPVLEALGEPVSYTEEASCAFTGLDKTYNYGGFFLNTYPIGDKDYIYGVCLMDDSSTTPEGIYIGATQAEVEAAYGTEGFNGSNAYVLTGTTSTLTIILTDGVVSSIQYDAVVE